MGARGLLEMFNLILYVSVNNFSVMWGLHEMNTKLEDLKVLKRSPDLLNKVKIGQGQLII